FKGRQWPRDAKNSAIVELYRDVDEWNADSGALTDRSAAACFQRSHHLGAVTVVLNRGHTLWREIGVADYFAIVFNERHSNIKRFRNFVCELDGISTNRTDTQITLGQSCRCRELIFNFRFKGVPKPRAEVIPHQQRDDHNRTDVEEHQARMKSEGHTVSPATTESHEI